MAAELAKIAGDMPGGRAGLGVKNGNKGGFAVRRGIVRSRPTMSFRA